MLTKRIGEKQDRNYTRMNATSYFERILEAISQETIAVRTLTSHLKNHSSKTNKTCRTLLEKQGRTRLWVSSIDPKHGRASVGQHTRTYLPQLCTDTGWRLEDQPGSMDDRDGWRERERERERERNPHCQSDLMMMMNIQVIQPYSGTDMLTVAKNFRFISSERSDFHMGNRTLYFTNTYCCRWLAYDQNNGLTQRVS